MRKQALVVAGETLIKIHENYKLREGFLELTDKMDVVIACRVSPK